MKRLHENNLLTVDQVAELLQISPKTIRNWTSARKLPSIKLNGIVRYAESDILSLIAENTRNAS